MGFVNMLFRSIGLGSALVVLLVVGWLASIEFNFTTMPSKDNWNWNKQTTQDASWAHTFVQTNGIKLHVIEAGEVHHPLIVLLHGFPETALLSWSEIINGLVDAGYHVIAPDMRGYNTSDKPEGKAAYALPELTKDIAGILDYASVSKAIIVGHDWGGAVAWNFAIQYPERTEKLIALNIPHPVAFGKKIESSLEQIRKSWYIFYIQFPYIPEAKFLRNNCTALQSLLSNSGKFGQTFSGDSIEKYVQAWTEPRAFTSMLNYYRNIGAARKLRQAGSNEVTSPVLMLWGRNDVAFAKGVEEESLAYCTHENTQLKYYDNCTHWISHEEPETILRDIVAFIQE